MVQRYVSNQGKSWKFNFPCANWYGGFFEILVKLTKRFLRKTLGKAFLSYEGLDTVFIETEVVLNSRPLMFIGSDIEEPPLTLSCLIMGCRLLETPGGSSEVDNSDTKLLTKRLKYLNT